jgi:THO complex subunit 4
MTSSLDMSLEDLIKINKQTGRGRGRGGGGGGGRDRVGESNGKTTGPVRSRGLSRLANRSAPYALSKARKIKLLIFCFKDNLQVAVTGIENIKIQIEIFQALNLRGHVVHLLSRYYRFSI